MKFSRDGGTVDFFVTICETESDCASNKGYSPPRLYKGETLPTLTGKVLRLVVKDYGRGISECDYAKCFRPFSQADQATESLYGGTGLGLSITSKLVHGLGGSISVQSVEGQWTTFTVDLPFTETPANTTSFSSILKNTNVYFVGCEKSEQDRFSDIFDSLNVKHSFIANFEELRPLANLQELRDGISDGDDPSPSRTQVFVVNEDVHDPETYNRLSSRRRSILLTFGPCFKFSEGRNHYRSLPQLLPSILLSDMSRYVQVPVLGAQGSVRQQPIVKVPIEKLGELKFLIAEDNKVNQKVLSRILTRLGITNIDIVDNGAQAVEREASKPFDVVLMDSKSTRCTRRLTTLHIPVLTFLYVLLLTVQMPVMEGKEATKLISSRSEEGTHPRAKVIFVTAHVADHFEDECRASGAVGFLAKPCTLTGVEDCLRTVLFGHKR